MQHQIEHGGVQDGCITQRLAGRGRPGQDENARTDDGADAERGEAPRAEGLAQALVRLLGSLNQSIDALGAE